MKEKAIFRLAFLEGEIEVNTDDNDVIIPLITEEMITNNTNKRTTFDTHKYITFERTKERCKELPIFEAHSITLPLDVKRNKVIKDGK